ncbi:MAG TPA: hypothetical protein VGN01_12290, partial [Acidobacteriaceae bacterium]
LLALILAPLAASAQKPNPAPPKPLFSENFESGAIDKNLWTQDVTGDAILTVQSDKVAHGKYALLARCPAPAMRTHAFLIAHNLPEPLRHHLFGRAYVYIAPVVPDRHTVLIQIGTAGWPHSKFMEVATSHSNFQTTFTDNVQNGEDWHPGPAIPLGRWVLLEWEFNDQPASETIWVDGEKVMDTPFTYKGATSDLVGGFTDAAFGFFLRGAAPAPFDIYFDSIALDTHRIGPIQ